MYVSARRCERELESALVEIRRPAVDLALRQQRRFAVATDPLEFARERCMLKRLEALELIGRRPLLQKPSELCIERAFDFLQIAARFGRSSDPYLTADLERRNLRRNVGCDLIVVYQPLVQTAVLATTERETRCCEQRHLIRGVAGNVPDFVDAGLRHAILHGGALVAIELRNPAFRARQRGTARNVSEVMLDLALHLGRIDVARDDQHCVRRSVPLLEPLAHVLERGGIQVLHGPDRRPRVRVTCGINICSDHLVHAAVGTVLALPLLVLDYTALFIEPRLIHRTEHVSHAIRLEPQRQIQRRGGHVLEIVRAIEPGGPVHRRGTRGPQRLEEVVVEVLRSVEHQVLEQMCEAGSSRPLILAADVIPDVDRDDRRLVILVQNQREPVGQHMLLVRNVHVRRRSRRRTSAYTEQHEKAGNTCEQTRPHQHLQ